ncbi:MAG TPA: hypothetical protein VH478_17760 [Trebonia sp.]|jgi:hypothetical protein|nr:hypothetical protein [Trebonia sp.]
MAPDEARAWIDVAIRVGRGEREDRLCPARPDGYLTVRGIPAPGGEAGEYEARCPAGGAADVLLTRRTGSRSPTTGKSGARR